MSRVGHVVIPEPGHRLAADDELVVRVGVTRGVEIGIFVNDVGRFATEFQRDFFQITGSGMDDELSDFCRAGEGDLVDMRMSRQSCAGGFPVARDDVDNAIREAGFADEIVEEVKDDNALLIDTLLKERDAHWRKELRAEKLVG